MTSDWSVLSVKRGINSAEGLVRLVDDETSTEKRILLLETEFGRLLATMSHSGSKVTSALKDAYDGKPLEVTVESRERSGLVSMSREQTSGRPMTIYALTNQGRETLLARTSEES